LVGVWENNGYGFDMSAARRLVVNTWGKGRVTPGQLLGEPRCWATLDYTTRDDPDVAARVEWAPHRAGVAHGLGVWFDATLLDGGGVRGPLPDVGGGAGARRRAGAEVRALTAAAGGPSCGT